MFAPPVREKKRERQEIRGITPMRMQGEREKQLLKEGLPRRERGRGFTPIRMPVRTTQALSAGNLLHITILTSNIKVIV